MSLPMDEDVKHYRLLRKGQEEREQAHTLPPAPLSIMMVEDGHTVVRRRWLQPIPEIEMSQSEAKMGVIITQHSLARVAAAIPDPLVALAEELLALSRKLAEHGLRPVGVNLTTGHQVPFGPPWHRDRYYAADPAAAVVDIDVTTLAAGWVTRMAEEFDAEATFKDA